MQKLGEGFSNNFDTPTKRNKIEKKQEIETVESLNQSIISNNEFKTPKQSPKRTPGSSSVMSLRSNISGSSVPFSPERVEELKPKPLRKIATNFFGIFIVLGILYGIYTAVIMYTSRTSYPMLPYCDSEDFYQQTTTCIDCPMYGYCSGGRLLLCEEPYILEGGTCIKNDPNIKMSVKIADFISYQLASKAGMIEFIIFNFIFC